MTANQFLSVQLAVQQYGYDLRVRPSRMARGHYEVVQRGLVIFSAATLQDVQAWLMGQ